MVNPQTTGFSVLTICRSDHPLDHFLNLLKTSAVDVVGHTRSYPCSHFAPRFDQRPPKEALFKSSLQYLYLGRLEAAVAADVVHGDTASEGDAGDVQAAMRGIFFGAGKGGTKFADAGFESARLCWKRSESAARL